MDAPSPPRFQLACSSSEAWRHPDAGACAVLWSPDGQTLVVVSHTTVAYAVPSGLPRWSHRRPLTRTGLLCSLGDRPAVLLAGGGDEAVALDLDTGKIVRTIDGCGRVACGASRPGGGFALGGAGLVSLYDADCARRGEVLADSPGEFFQLVFSPDGRLLLGSQLGNSAALFDADALTLLRRLGTPERPALRSVFARGGRVALCHDGGTALHTIDLATDTVCARSEVHGGLVIWLDAPGCGEAFVVLRHGAGLHGGRLGEAATPRVPTEAEPILAMAASPDLTQWALVRGPRVERIDAATGTALDRFEGHQVGVTGVYASWARDAVLSVDSGATVRTWSLPALTPVGVVRAARGDTVRRLAAAPEGDAVWLVDHHPQGQRVYDFATEAVRVERFLSRDQHDRWQAAGLTVRKEARQLRIERDDGTVACVPARVERGALSRDGRRFAWLGQRKLTVLDTATLQTLGQARAPMATGLAWGVRPDRLVVMHTQGAALFDAATVTLLAEHAPPGLLAWALATGRVDPVVAVNSGHTVTLLSLDDFTPLCGALALPSFAPTADLSRDDRVLITGHHNGCVYTWDVDAWRRETAAERALLVVKRPAPKKPRKAAPKG